MSKPKRIKCVTCGGDKGIRNFYISNNPLHSNGYIPYCKDCLAVSLGDYTMGEVKNTLRQIDRPYLHDVWEKALEEEDNTFGVYMRHLGLNHNRDLTWDDSRFEENQDGENTIGEGDHMQKISSKELRELEDDWGYGYDVERLIYFERKYKSLVSNYPVNTAIHEEALRAYCVYKVQAEMATAANDVEGAQKWGRLAQNQGEIAKINLNKLSKSDLSQGLDGFSELAREVEAAVDIVPILPKFIAKPHDEIDFALYCYINYMRRLEGRQEVEHADIYNFYNETLEEHLKNNPDLEEYAVEVEVDDGMGGKKKVKTIDMTPKIERLKAEHPDNSFYQNLDKWVEVVSYFRFFPDLFFDMIRPENGGMRLDADQRMLLRGMARFRLNMGVFSRGYGKCVAGDTIINTDEGYKEIGKFFDYQDDGVETEKEIDINIMNRYGIKEKTTAGVYSGYKTTRKIKTEEGFEIEATLVHPLLVKRECNKLEWIKAKDIQQGDYLVAIRENNLYGDTKIKSIEEIGTRIIKGAYDSLPNEVLTAEKDALKKLLVYILEDGTVDEDKVYLKLKTEKLVKELQVLLLGFGIISTIDEKDDKQLRVSRKEVSLLKNNEEILYEDKYYYTKVSRIEESRNHVYDLQVPITQSFVGNGIVNHNTMVQLMYNYHTAVWYPSTNLVMTAQTKENAASLIGEKHNEMKRFFPMLVDEIISPEHKGVKISKDRAEINFKSGATLDTLANAQSSKGARRHRITIEESAQVSKFTFEDVLEPVVNVPRMTMGNMGVVNPYELNGQINRFSTSWYKGKKIAL